jgi:2-deoxy-D-gluconate 3-dehydrogenase
MLFDISGKNALITGASRGLGLGIAEGFAKAGANLILVARNIAPETVSELEQYGTKVKAYSLDLSHPEQIPAFIEDILAEWSRIDILVNDAGTQRRHDSVEFPDEDWDWVTTINAKSVFVLCREVGKHMVANGKGKIINFASLLSYQGGFRVPAYAASKGAVMQFTKSLSNEWASKGVNVNCIAPGYFDTEMNTALIADPVRNEQITVRIPIGRWGKPSDLVGTAIFLASEASDYVSGITIPVDGGWLGR